MDPKARTLSVSQSFVPRATEYACGKPKAGTTWQWSAVDTSVVRVNATTGEVLALRVGSTSVGAKSVNSIAVADLTVTVVP